MIGRILQWLLPLASIVAPLIWGANLSPVQRLFLATAPLILSLKISVLLRIPLSVLKNYSKFGLVLYLLCWPGMSPVPFKIRSSDRSVSKRRIFAGIAFFSSGIISLFLISIFKSSLSQSELGWGGIFAILLTIHFGFSELLTESLRFLGWRVNPLFLDPLSSLSLREFWGKRWNLAFVEMNHLLFLPLARAFLKERFAIFAVFVVSALLHEFAISFPAGAGWGGPFLYFALHGMLVHVEKNAVAINSRSHIFRRVWTLGWILLPLPTLFNSHFRNQLIFPLIDFLHATLC